MLCAVGDVCPGFRSVVVEGFERGWVRHVDLMFSFVLSFVF